MDTQDIFYKIGNLDKAIPLFNLGLEKESLKLKYSGRLDNTPHSELLGSSLTHPSITTDFSESLLEFVTPTFHHLQDVYHYLFDIQKFTYSTLSHNLFWSLSMPSIIHSEKEIKIAEYGTSNEGLMKYFYRKGLELRYGKMMQVIAGIHYNFSITDDVWQVLDVDPLDQEKKTQYYLSLLRYINRYNWLLVYLFGASPIVDQHYFSDNDSNIKTFNRYHNLCYYPYATSIRTSHFGYSNIYQQTINVKYNDIQEYVNTLKKAIMTPSSLYASFGLKEGENYYQLNTNYLQIENEFYAMCRPKAIPQQGEHFLHKLFQGIEYIELRTVDLNPYSPFGISYKQAQFLNLFLLNGLLHYTPLDSENIMIDNQINLKNTTLYGRKKNLILLKDSKDTFLWEWQKDLFDELLPLAYALDSKEKSTEYQDCLRYFSNTINQPENTISHKVFVDTIKYGYQNLGLKIAKQHQEFHEKSLYKRMSGMTFNILAKRSLMEQKEIETKSNQVFSKYLHDFYQNNYSSNGVPSF